MAITGFTLTCPDLSAGVEFLAHLGLDSQLTGDVCMANLGPDAFNCITLVSGPQKKLQRLTFCCRPGDFALFADDHWHTTGDGRLVTNDPDGIEIELVPSGYHAPRPSESLLLPHSPLHADLNVPAPVALSHVAIFVSDVSQSLEFYERRLGLALSDRCGDGIAFLHGRHGGGHHQLALIRSSGPGLHHYALEMGTVDAIGLRATSMAGKGHSRGWGLGRHVLGSNFFHYVQDPWGSYAELTAGLDYIAEDEVWAAGDHAPEDSLYLWGPPPPSDFIINPEAMAPVS
ncbi:MAG: metapyrocatechase [Rhodospirillales bacterium]|nr:metapyrocatechase [Rhodospirillales bacterium]